MKCIDCELWMQHSVMVRKQQVFLDKGTCVNRFHAERANAVPKITASICNCSRGALKRKRNTSIAYTTIGEA